MRSVARLCLHGLAVSLGSLALASGAVPARAHDHPVPEPLNSEIRHSGRFGGVELDYDARVERTHLPATENLPAVDMVSTAYLRTDTNDDAERPVLFLFNGGPGAASSWLHMGALGPVRIDAPSDPAEPPQGLATTPNTHTLLDMADLVFIDPPETGFSRVADGSDVDPLLTVSGDAELIARFVETWLSEHGRTGAPVFLLGESYGTIRATAMAGLMAERGTLDGIVLLGQAVNMIETSQRADNIVSYATNLSALAAIAAYHGRADTGGLAIPDFIDAVHAWAMSDYLLALVQGTALADSERQAIAARLEAVTGISRDTYLETGLIFTKAAFRRALLADENRVLAVYDARYTGPAPEPGERAQDPFAPVAAMIPQALTRHFTTTLGVNLPVEDYRSYWSGASNWRWLPTGGMGGPFDDFDYTAHLEAALAADPGFRIMVGTGRYDTTTTIGPARYLARQIEGADGRILVREYEGGHMAYTNPEALADLTSDLRAFIAGTPASPAEEQ